MSLSPRNFAEAAGTAEAARGSCLVYRNHITGLGPSGCDGWTLQIRGNFMYANDMIFPPPHDYKEETDLEYRKECSKDLVVQVKKIQEEIHLKDILENIVVVK